MLNQPFLRYSFFIPYSTNKIRHSALTCLRRVYLAFRGFNDFHNPCHVASQFAHHFDTFNIFKWIFKTFVATYLLTNCFTIVMAVFDVAQTVVANSAGIINGNLDVAASMADLETQLQAMGIWELIGLWLETNIINLCMWILSIVIFVIVYGRMIEIYLTVSIAPIPFSTLANREWGAMGTNYLRSLFALGFQGFLILICVAIYAVLVQSIPSSSSVHAAIWGTAGYTVLLAFALFKTGSLSKSIFNAH